MHRRGKSTNPRQQKVEGWSFIGQGRISELEVEGRKGSRQSPNRGGGAALRAIWAHGEGDELTLVAQSAEP